jgi:hypothetical protein
MIKKIAVVLTLLLLLLVANSACVVVITNTGPGYYGTGGTTYYDTITPKAQLEITRNELSHDFDGNKIGIVSIKNVSDYNCNIASVTGKFYDASMNLVYSSTDTIVNLGPGETWDYPLR